MIILFKDNLKSGRFEVSEKEFKTKFEKYVEVEQMEAFPIISQVLSFVARVYRSTFDKEEVDKMLKAIK